MTRRAFVDPDRLRWDGDGPRPLPVVLWYPTADGTGAEDIVIGRPASPLFRVGRAVPDAPIAGGRLPTVVLSHGTGGSALQLGWLAQALAEHGFLVVGVHHHGNTAAEPALTPQGASLWWERARDLTVVLDRVMADPELGPHVDGDRIGAAGFSLGGWTVVALAGGRTDLAGFEAWCATTPDASCADAPELPDAHAKLAEMKDDPRVVASLARAHAPTHDPRIRGVVAIAPALLHAFTAASLEAIDVPVLAIGGTADPIAPMATNATYLADTVPGAEQLALDASHYTFLSVCGKAGPKALCADPPGVDRAGAHALAAERAVTFFESMGSAP